jgi:hypothetical protein
MSRAPILAAQHSPQRAASPPPSAAPLNRISTSATSVSYLCVLCVSPFSLNFELSTVHFDSARPRSYTTPQQSPLCFHNLTNPSFRNRFIYTHLSKYRGTPPLLRATSEPILEVYALSPIAPVTKRKPAPLTRVAAPAYNACSSRVRAVLVYPESQRAARSEKMMNGGRELLAGLRRVRS